MIGVEFVSAVVGLIDVGAKVVTLCSTYLRSVSNAQKSANELLSEVSLLQSSLGQLVVYAGTVDPGSPSETSLSNLDNPLKDSTERLSDVLETLNKSLGKDRPSTKMIAIQKLAWPFKEKELKSILASLTRLRSNITAAVTVEVG
jgi:hypothetical protein